MMGLALFAQMQSRTYYEWMRVRQLDEWWHWLALAGGAATLVLFVVATYRRDAAQLGRGTRYALLALRVLAFVGLLLFFLDLQKRSEQQLVKNSRFAVLVDTSQSMGIVDRPRDTGEGSEARVDAVVRAFAGTDWFEQLREKHDVTVYRFDETNQPEELAAFPVREAPAAGVESAVVDTGQPVREVQTLWRVALGALLLAVVALVGHWLLGRFVRTSEGESWAVLVAVFLLIVGLTLIAVGNLRHPEVSLPVALGLAQPEPAPEAPEERAEDKAAADDVMSPSDRDWAQLLAPRGGSTRLGDAIAWVLAKERGAPLAGIAVLTDGNGNRGLAMNVAAKLAAEAEVPLYPIGLGSERPPTNVRLVDLEAPLRVYPGDEFKLTGYVQAYGMAGRVVQLRLVSRPDGEDDAEPMLEAEVAVELAEDGKVIPVPLQVTPEAVGKRIYTLQVTEQNVDPDESDNLIVAKVQIVDRKSRVLLVAGGPTREYRFVRNMLHRDKDVTVDVLLQTGVEGISQDAASILFELPSDPAEFFEYDAVVAFDPDWTQFDLAQTELLETWVGEKAGGLVAIAGPVHTAAWAETRRAPPQVAPLRQLYPVTFNTTRIELGRYGSESAWPLMITKDGAQVGFLEVSDAELEPLEIWTQFPGVYGYYPTRSVKSAATVFARFSDPQAALSEVQPPLVVGQFYGSGRVVFLGTGEFWRLRAMDEGYFERFYTKLIRYVSEGRLLRDSNRGLLLVDKNRALRGDAIGLRASVLDQQFQPLLDLTVPLSVRRPDGEREQLELGRADGGRDGMYSGRYRVSQPGDYVFELVLPGEGEPVILEREVRVRLPNLEIERPQRDDATLRSVASSTGGNYFVGLPSALAGDPSLAALVPSKRRETYLPGTPDLAFQERWMRWLLTLICGVLFLEWMIRRLSKLA